MRGERMVYPRRMSDSKMEVEEIGLGSLYRYYRSFSEARAVQITTLRVWAPADEHRTFAAARDDKP